jgi:hypothetical protein
MSRTSEGLNPRPYGGLPGFKEPTTSRDASRAVATFSSLLRERVFAAIRAAGRDGRTPDEAAADVGETVLAVRPRVTELAKAGRIVKTGARRKNVSGLLAKAWRSR